MEPKFTNDFETSWGDYRKKLLTLQTGDWRSIRPVLDRDVCKQCGWCNMLCPAGCMIKRADGYYHPDLEYCKGCGVCACECPAHALTMITEEEACRND